MRVKQEESRARQAALLARLAFVQKQTETLGPPPLGLGRMGTCSAPP